MADLVLRVCPSGQRHCPCLRDMWARVLGLHNIGTRDRSLEFPLFFKILGKKHTQKACSVWGVSVSWDISSIPLAAELPCGHTLQAGIWSRSAGELKTPLAGPQAWHRAAYCLCHLFTYSFHKCFLSTREAPFCVLGK